MKEKSLSAPKLKSRVDSTVRGGSPELRFIFSM
jgi:hypothetical protein